MKGLKKLGIILAVVVVIIFAAFYIVKAQPTPKIEVGALDLNTVADGNYQGTYEKGPVKVVLVVAVQDHSITNIEIIEHRTGLGKKAEKITESIIKAQSVDVDVVSGASLSSNVIRKAVEGALSH